MNTKYATDQQAVVIGAGIAGLLAAQVLACHRFRVLLVDRDRLPDHPQRRTGVPQGDHVHALFARGLRAIEALLPGFSSELSRRGGQRIDVCRDMVMITRHGCGARFPSGFDVIGASRALIEAVVRERVLAQPGVQVLDQHRADSLIGTARHVTAVRICERTTQRVHDIPATLVVDAAGRGSRLPCWLAQLGCPTVPETVIDAHVGYATRLYRRHDGHPQADWRACYVPMLGPASTRGGVLAPIEDDRWIVTLTGIGADRPTAAPEEFLPFARTLVTPLIAEAIATAEPLSPVRRSNTTANQRRHLERLGNRLPDNLIAVGDSVCTFNPVYAQGMTVAALGAHLLDRCLTTGFSAHRFHRRLSALHSVPWLLATTADYRFPTTDGPPAAHYHQLLGSYVDRLVLAGTYDPRAQAAFLAVLNMVRHPARLLTPPLPIRVATARPTRR